MSFVVHFVTAETAALPDPLQAGEVTSDAPAELTPEEIATWDGLHPRLVELLPAGSHDVAQNHFSRQLVHDPSGLMVTWTHQDYQASLPFWSVNASTETFGVLVRLTEAIEAGTGLIGVDEISNHRFLDHQSDVKASFEAIADGFEEAMDSQTVLGWLRNLFHKRS